MTNLSTSPVQVRKPRRNRKNTFISFLTKHSATLINSVGFVGSALRDVLVVAKNDDSSIANCTSSIMCRCLSSIWLSTSATCSCEKVKIDRIVRRKKTININDECYVVKVGQENCPQYRSRAKLLMRPQPKNP